MKKKVLAFVMAAAMVFSLAACGGSSNAGSDSSNSDSSASDSSDSSSTATGAAFKLGGTAPLTGGAAIYGNAVKNGAQIAVDEINAEGGAIQFELKYEDDQHDAEKAVNAYNALKDWGMQISLGSVTTKPCEATSVLNNEDRIFALTPSASSEATTERQGQYVPDVLHRPQPGFRFRRVYLRKEVWATKVAVIWKNDDVYSKGIHDTFTAEAAVNWALRLFPTPPSLMATTPTSPCSWLTPRARALSWCSCPCTISPLP